MLSIDFIREHVEEVREASKNKNKKVDLDKILTLDDKRRNLIQQIQGLREQRNTKTHEKPSEEMIQKGKEIKEQLSTLEASLSEIENQLHEEMILVPNMPFKEVPVGPDESGNVVIRTWGKPPTFSFEPKDHVALGQALDIIDIETAGKVTGSRFVYLKGELAILEYAIVMYVFQLLSNKEKLQKIADTIKPGYNAKPFTPVVPPVMIRPEVFTRMGRLDRDTAEERYHLPKDNLYLIGSAEHTLGPMFMDTIIPEEQLPIRYIGFSTSFRREAGSYGKDVKGMLRVHQFDKLEMESFTTAEDSATEQEFIVAIQEHLMQSLHIPYQVMMICTGDMGGPDARQYDIEAWLPAQNTYRETHTSDLMTDYQARRLNTKVKRKDGTTELVHMNDATAFAIGRILIAIMENYQQEDGSIKIPEVLIPLVGFDSIRAKKSV